MVLGGSWSLPMRRLSTQLNWVALEKSQGLERPRSSSMMESTVQWHVSCGGCKGEGGIKIGIYLIACFIPTIQSAPVPICSFSLHPLFNSISKSVINSLY